MLSPLATQWLRYARSIFACTAHHAVCDAPAMSSIDPLIRWPGFIGPSYENAKKRLLLVGRIHNPTGWSAFPGLGGLEPYIRDWLDERISDEQFYTLFNREYARRLAHWGPWTKLYQHLARAAGVDETGVAYTNVAKCWQTAGIKETRLQRACSSAFPLEELVQIVKPDGVFLLATPSWVAKIRGAQVCSVPFRCDSAPYFYLPLERMEEAEAWVRGL